MLSTIIASLIGYTAGALMVGMFWAMWFSEEYKGTSRQAEWTKELTVPAVWVGTGVLWPVFLVITIGIGLRMFFDTLSTAVKPLWKAYLGLIEKRVS